LYYDCVGVFYFAFASHFRLFFSVPSRQSSGAKPLWIVCLNFHAEIYGVSRRREKKVTHGCRISTISAARVEGENFFGSTTSTTTRRTPLTLT
jgi:hypothetical protein